MTYTIPMLCSVTGAWLRLPREAFDGVVLTPIFSRYASKAKVRLLDSKVFSASVSDFELFETKALRSFYFSKELRDTKFYNEPFIEPEDVIVGVEGCFREFEKAQHKGKSA